MNIDSETKLFFENLSKEKDFDKIKLQLSVKKFYHRYTGINCFVFLNRNIDYVIKLSDHHDSIPRKNSIFYKHYAKVLYRTKNKKIILQEKVNIETTRDKQKFIDEFCKKIKINAHDLDWHYDLHSSNFGIKDDKLLIIDYRNYKYKDFSKYHNNKTWHNKKINVNKKTLK